MTPKQWAAQLGEGVTSPLVIESVEKLIAGAVAEEREACAIECDRVAEDLRLGVGLLPKLTGSGAADLCALRIRRRSGASS